MRSFLIITILAVGLAVAAYGTPGDVQRFIPCPSGYTQGLAFDGKFLWTADRRTDMLYKIDPADGLLLDSIPTPGYAVTGLTSDGKWLWLLDAEEGKMFAIDPTDRLVKRTLFTYISQPGGVAWDGKYLWLVDDGDNKILRLDPNDGTTIASIPAPSGGCGALTFDGHYLWVGDRNRDGIFMVTPEHGDVILTLKAPGRYISGLAWENNSLWVADYQSDKCYRLTVDDGTICSKTDQRIENLEYVHQVRNFGPDTVTSVQVYVAIPHDLNNQKLLGPITYDPKPTEMTKDKWGQEIAQFEFTGLPQGQATSVSMKLKVELCRNRYFVFPEKVGKLADIPKEVRDKYLVDDIKFSYTDPVIQNALKAAVGDETNPYWIGRKIFNYCIEHLTYERVGGWNLAPAVLTRGNGSCSEYTFVYIAMCRAAGLPARYAGAITHRGDDASWDDVYHRWVEIYLPNYGWFPVDPSGGDSPWPCDQANGFGYIDNRFVITTLGGGGSEFLDWGYNANERWTSRGRCKVVVEGFGEWTPAEPEA